MRLPTPGQFEARMPSPGWVKPVTLAHVFERYNGNGEDVGTLAMFSPVAAKFFFRAAPRAARSRASISNKPPEPKAPAAPSGGQELSAKVNHVIAPNGKERRATVALEP